jgi:opacity protein-like surface antigen
LKRIVLILAMLASFSIIARGQALPAAARAGDLQIGGTFTFSYPDYTPQDALGGGVYIDFDFTTHWGAEVDFRQVDISQHSPAYERSYEYGARYHRYYGIYKPYARAGLGRGVFNFPGPNGTVAGNLAYNMYQGALGVDISVTPRINVRAEFEYQRWASGVGLEDALTPINYSVGAAYHFNAGWPR